MENSIEWGVVSAADTGAFHKRERIWILANARSGRRSESGSREMEQPGRAEAIGAGDVSDANGMRQLQPQWIERDERHGLGIGGQDVADSTSIRQQGSRQRINTSNQASNRKREAGNAFDVRQLREWPPEPGVG